MTKSGFLLFQNLGFVLLLQLLIGKHVLRVFDGQVLHLEDEAPNWVRIYDEVCDGPHVVDRRLELASEYQQENLCYD